MARSARLTRILDGLAKMYPDAHCELVFKNAFELLIATVLSAQSTDKQVNKVTPPLFKDYPTPESFLSLTEDKLSEYIKGLGLFRNKSKYILEACRILMERHDGHVPQERELLEELPGVGRKTANVVLGNAFEIPAFAVDTHVHRVANRLALAKSKNVMETERQLTKKIRRSQWVYTHHCLIWHGRRLCVARKPKCSQCALLPDCPYGQENTLL